MNIVAGVAAVLAAALIAHASPAESGQRAAGPERLAAQGDQADQARARREEILRRRDALRARQEELRRLRQEARRGPMASGALRWSIRIGRQGTFSLVNGSGRVTITGEGDRDTVSIEATKRVWDQTEAAAKASLADVGVEVDDRRDAVDVRTVFPRAGRLDAEVDFAITVPAGATVSVRTGSGDVTVTGVRGELRVETVGGGITATSVGQVRLLRTLSGAVSLENADSSDMTVSTLGGPVTIRRLKARSADLRTVGGDLVVTDSEAERVIAQSLNGRIELTGRLARTGRYSLQSQSGEVRLTPAGDDFELEAATVNGTVRSDFPITVDDRRELTAPPGRGQGRGIGRGIGRAGRGNTRILRGISGEGGALVTLRSFGGDITISKR